MTDTPKCEWKSKDAFKDSFHTACGEWYMCDVNGGPDNMRFCPWCGKQIEVISDASADHG